jgi:zinc protease
MYAFLLSAALAADPLTLDAGPQGTSVHKLANGLTVVLQEDHRTDTVALHIRYGVGGHDEKAGEHGCAHLFEHLMFEGSAHVGMNKFDEWLTAAGGENNAFTSDDQTAYHMTFPSGASELALFLDSDRLGWLLEGVNQGNLDNQRLVVLQERAEGYEQPNGRDWDALQTLMYGEGHPYHVPVIGTIADVQGFQIPAVHAFFKAHYRTRNAVLVLIGNFETKDMLAKVEKWFGPIPDAGPTEPRPAWPDATATHKDGYLEDSVEQRTIYLAWPTVPIGHKDAPALDLLGYVLSGGRGTRLDDALYFDKNIASDEGAFPYHMDAEGMFIVYATSPKKSLASVSTLAQTIVSDVATDPPTAAELDRARRQLKSDLLDPLERLESRAEWMADCQVYDGRPDCLADRWKKYEAVTTDDLARVAATYLFTERRTSLSVVPRGDTGYLAGAVPVELP